MRKRIKAYLNLATSESGETKARVLRSGMWVGAAEILNSGSGFVRSIILARLLSPEMFGLMGIASVVIRAIDNFTQSGIRQALIQRQASFEDAQDTAFMLFLLRGIILTILLLAVAPLLAEFYEADELEPILQVLSITFMIGSLANINLVRYQKDLNFARLTYISQTASLVSTVAVITAAYWLRSVWALVIGQLVLTILNTILSYLFVPGTPRVAVNWKIARELLSYSKYITAASAILLIATEIDSAVIGKLLGTEQLGYYVLAFTVANIVTANLSKIISSVMMPAYSKLQFDMGAVRRAYLRTLSFTLLLTVPVAVGLIVVAKDLILVVYGPKWSDAIPLLQILAIFGVLRTAVSINGYLFQGIGRPDISLKLSTLRLVTVLSSIIPMIMFYGLPGAAIAVTAAIAVQWVGSLYFMSNTLEIGLRDNLSAFFCPLWKGSIMGTMVYLMSGWVKGDTVFGLGSLVVTGMIIYALLNFQVLIKIRRHGI